jgi:Ig-like domain from next to BRCA1 gene
MSWGLRALWRVLGLILLGLSLAACQGSEEQLTPFKPPTVATNATPPAQSVVQPSPTMPEARPTTTPVCADSLTFLEDITIPDGSQVNPGAILDKRWLIKNSGSCNWDESYRVKLVSGPDMGVPIEQALYPARSGSEVSMRIVLSAPQDPGYYQSAWQAFNPNDDPFGDPFYVEILVEIPSTPP